MKSSVRSKILISMIGITLLVVLAMSSVFYMKSADSVEDNYVTLLQQKIKLMSDTIDDMLKDICNININASCDKEIKKELEGYLLDRDQGRLNGISARLRIFCKKNDAISSMYLLIPQEDQIVTTLDYPVYRRGLSAQKKQEFLEAVRKDSGPLILEDIIHEGSKLLSFADRIVNEQGEVIGYVCANLEEKLFTYEYFGLPENAAMGEICMVKKGQVIASELPSQMGEVFYEDDTYFQWITRRNAIGADRKNIYIYREGGFSGCGIFARIDRNAILGDLRDMRKQVGGIAVVFILLAVGVALYLTRLVYRPVKKLTVTMKQVSKGDLSTRAEVISRDEIGMAAEEFNKMLDRIDELIVQLLEEEKRKKDAELEALQYQITPHFMYNTLNSIKCYAMIRGEKEIATVIEDFVELLQTCIRKKGAFLTVAEEMQVLRNYLRIQEFRNGETLDVEYQVAVEAEQCLVPRLILQPLVENAILHGLDIKKGQSKLVIRAWTEGEILYLEVSDNGRGMSQEQIRELLNRKIKKTKGLTAVGIPNVRDRLNLYYGKEAELSYESKGKGTTARIFLPTIRNGGTDYEESIAGR